MQQAKHHPILFSTPMVQAILAGRKTQTRRMVKPQPDDDGLWNDTEFPRSIQSTLKGWNGTLEETGASKEWKCPYGQVGDTLWVRETWRPNVHNPGAFKYRAGCTREEERYPWKPSIHMPKAASRIHLRITSITVQRLNAITDADAISEGIMEKESFITGSLSYGKVF